MRENEGTQEQNYRERGKPPFIDARIRQFDSSRHTVGLLPVLGVHGTVTVRPGTTPRLTGRSVSGVRACNQISRSLHSPDRGNGALQRDRADYPVPYRIDRVQPSSYNQGMISVRNSVLRRMAMVNDAYKSMAKRHTVPACQAEAAVFGASRQAFAGSAADRAGRAGGFRPPGRGGKSPDDLFVHAIDPIDQFPVFYFGDFRR